MINIKYLIVVLCVGCGSLCQAAVHYEAGKEQTIDIAVTVYNNNYGLIRETRALSLPVGEVELEFQDVAALIDATSVAVVSKTAPGKFRVLEQNYRYDLLNRQTLLDRYLGMELEFIRAADGSDFREVRKGRLVSNQGDLIVEFESGIEINPAGTIAFHDLPDNLLAKPTLVWMLDNQVGDKQLIEASYLTNGLSWQADYVAILDESDSGLDLTAWVTLENRSGADYKNAQLKVVAGDVKRVTVARQPVMLEMQDFGAKAMRDSMQEESFFEYHLYALDRKTNLANNETKQVNLLARDGVAVTKHLEVESSAQVYGFDQNTLKKNARVILRLDNSEQNNMGIALPAGRVRVYKADSSGALQLVGEERIKHTARDEQVELELGESFDVVAERKQTSFRKRGERESEVSYEIEVRNRKQVEQQVKVIEHLTGDWVITQESQAHHKVDSGTVEYEITIPKGGVKIISYSARTSW